MLVLCGSVSKNNVDNFWKLDKINQGVGSIGTENQNGGKQYKFFI